MADQEINKLFRAFQIDPSPINCYLYRNACLRSGLVERVGFELGDLVEVEEARVHPWTKSRKFTGYLAHFRYLEYAPRIYSWQPFIYPSSFLKDFKWSVFTNENDFNKYLSFQGGLILEPNSTIKILSVSNPNSEMYDLLSNIFKRLEKEFSNDVYMREFRPGFKMVTGLTWTEWQHNLELQKREF